MKNDLRWVKPKVLLTPPYESYDARGVKCPRCRTHHLHHGRVRVWVCGEDEEDTLRVTVDLDKSVGNLVASRDGLPSSRRHGVGILCWCEACHGVSELCISQHKGVTEVFWREPQDVPRSAASAFSMTRYSEMPGEGGVS